MDTLMRDVLKKKAQTDSMLLSTVDIQGFNITKYIAIVTGTAVNSSGAATDYMARIKDFTGGNLNGYAIDFNRVVNEALGDLVANAKKHGANAIIGIKLDTATISTERGGFFFANAIGTAVYGEFTQDNKDNR